MFADPKRQLADNAWTGVPGNIKLCMKVALALIRNNEVVFFKMTAV